MILEITTSTEKFLFHLFHKVTWAGVLWRLFASLIRKPGADSWKQISSFLCPVPNLFSSCFLYSPIIWHLPPVSSTMWSPHNSSLGSLHSPGTVSVDFLHIDCLFLRELSKLPERKLQLFSKLTSLHYLRMLLRCILLCKQDWGVRGVRFHLPMQSSLTHRESSTFSIYRATLPPNMRVFTSHHSDCIMQNDPLTWQLLIPPVL